MTSASWRDSPLRRPPVDELLPLALLCLLLVLVLYALAVRQVLRHGKDLRHGKELRATALLLLGSAFLLGLGAWAAGGWAGHHFAFAQLPLVGCLALAFRERAPAVGVAIAGISLASLAAAHRAPLYPWAGSDVGPALDRAAAVAVADADPKVVVNCGSWGCFYAGQLLARGHVPIVYGFQPTDMARLGGQTRARGGSLIHLCYGCDVVSVRRAYGAEEVVELRSSSRSWKVFRVRP